MVFGYGVRFMSDGVGIVSVEAVWDVAVSEYGRLDVVIYWISWINLLQGAEVVKGCE